MKNIGIDIEKRKYFVCVIDDDMTNVLEGTNYENMRNTKQFARILLCLTWTYCASDRPSLLYRDMVSDVFLLQRTISLDTRRHLNLN